MANKEFQVNEKVRIELVSGGAIEGDFVQKNETSISVKNAVALPSGKRYQHNVTFYFAVIKDCHSIDDRSKCAENPIANKDTSSTSSVVDDSSKHCSSSTSSSAGCMKKTLGDSEIERIKTFVKNFVYIPQYDDKYHSAIRDLRQQKVIAVNSENHFGRLDPKKPLTAVASSRRVYLFDMLRLGAMKKEFKEVFSANTPCKIVHRSTQFSDYLTHTEKCTMANAFDTLMVHFTLKQTRECIGLLDCLKVYFDLPKFFFDLAEKNFDYGARPLQDDAKLRSALSVQLLMELYWHFNDILMRPLRVATQQFSDIRPSVENLKPDVKNIDLNEASKLEELFADFLTE